MDRTEFMFPDERALMNAFARSLQDPSEHRAISIATLAAMAGLDVDRAERAAAALQERSMVVVSGAISAGPAETLCIPIGKGRELVRWLAAHAQRQHRPRSRKPEGPSLHRSAQPGRSRGDGA